MKSNYKIRAKKFMEELMPYLHNFNSPIRVANDVREYTQDHPRRNIQICNGAVRIAIITSDYVIKWDYDKESMRDYGGCTSEKRLYKKVCADGFGYLFAEISSFRLNHKTFYVMPRVSVNEYRDNNIWSYLTENEKTYLRKTITDLHNGNWGMYHKKPIIIDYAMERKSWW